MMRAATVLLALVMASPALAERLDLPDDFPARLRAVLPCGDANFISTPSSALAFCGGPSPSVEFILLPPGPDARTTIARLQASCGARVPDCGIVPLRISGAEGWLASERHAGPVHATALVPIGDRLLEIRSMAPDAEGATATARAAAQLIVPHIPTTAIDPD